MGDGWLLQWLLSFVAVYYIIYSQMSGRWLVVAVVVVDCCSV